MSATRPASSGLTPFTMTPGDPRSGVILHVPHSARAIPEWVRAGIVLSGAALDSELDAMTDTATDVLAAAAAAAATVAPFVFTNNLSRLVVDPERFPDDREAMRSVGMGAVYTRTHDGAVLREDDPDLESTLVETYYRPYAAAMAAAVQDRVDQTGSCLIVDVHSYPAVAAPYEQHQQAHRPRVCLGTDPFHTPRWLRDVAAEAFPGIHAFGGPFDGCYVPLAHYGRHRSVTALNVEKEIILPRPLSQPPTDPARRHQPRTACRTLGSRQSGT